MGKMGDVVITFVLIILGLALTPTVADSAAEAAAAGNITGTISATLIALVPMFWVIIILAIGVAAVYVQFRGMS